MMIPPLLLLPPPLRLVPFLLVRAAGIPLTLTVTPSHGVKAVLLAVNVAFSEIGHLLTVGLTGHLVLMLIVRLPPPQRQTLTTTPTMMMTVVPIVERANGVQTFLLGLFTPVSVGGSGGEAHRYFGVVQMTVSAHVPRETGQRVLVVRFPLLVA